MQIIDEKVRVLYHRVHKSGLQAAFFMPEIHGVNGRLQISAKHRPKTKLHINQTFSKASPQLTAWNARKHCICCGQLWTRSGENDE
jgi:hypothetical protein